jgi:hypothetical protein
MEFPVFFASQVLIRSIDRPCICEAYSVTSYRVVMTYWLINPPFSCQKLLILYVITHLKLCTCRIITESTEHKPFWEADGEGILRRLWNLASLLCSHDTATSGWWGWGGRDMWHPGGRGEMLTMFWLEIPKGRDHEDDRNVDGRITLGRNLGI